MPRIHTRFFSDNDRSDKRIRILFLIPSFKTGGAEIQLLSLVRGLDKSLFNVTIAAFYQGNELDSFFENHPEISVFFLGKKGALDFSFVRRLFTLMKQQQFDIVQSYNVSARFFGMITAKKARVPVVITTERTARLIYSSIGSRFYLFFEKYTTRSADALIANSEAGRCFAIQRGVRRERTAVIYNGIDPERFCFTRGRDSLRTELFIPKDAFVVGMLARIDKLKDPFTFLDAARRVFEKNELARFMLVGDGPMLESVKKQAVAMGLKNRIIFTGLRTDVADLLNCMDVVLLTSYRVEGCSNSLLEAMALGKPVIATRVGGNLELVVNERTGLLVDPRNPAQVADAVLRLYRDEALCRTMVENARRLVEIKFSQRAMVSQHEKLYLELYKSSFRTRHAYE